MSGPRHLWSGDWERESADAARNRPGPPEPPPDAGEEELVEPSPGRRRSARTIAIAAITAIVVVAVGVVLADVLGGSSKPRPRPVASVPNPTGNSGLPHQQPAPNGGSALKPTPATPTTPGAQVAPGTQTSPGGSQQGSGGNQAGPGGSVKPTPSTQAPQPTFTNQPAVNWLGMQIITSPTGAVVNSVQIGSEGDHAGFEPGDVIAEVAGSQIDSARAIQTAVAHVSVGGRLTVQIARGSSLITMAVTMQGRPTLQP
jgi:membrane-associated protease RseP (regulator of RpoE activity)